MATGYDTLDRLAGFLPSWLAWPASALSTLGGFAGAGLILLSAATGSVPAAIWAGVAFVGGALFWHLAELAGDQG